MIPMTTSVAMSSISVKPVNFERSDEPSMPRGTAASRVTSRSAGRRMKTCRGRSRLRR
jgi:hypothetical protein